MSVKPSTIERTIHVENLARVEGEGALYIKAVGDEITDVQLNIFEPPRFYEAFLRGRGYREVPDITARICGICPVAYQMSSCHALEQAHGVTVGEPLRTLRRLLYCGEWIESHVLHMFMLHLPDFLGYESVVTMAADHKDVVAKALALKKAGNDIVNFIGGREVHPINVRVGGFYRLPSQAKAKALRETLLKNREFAVETIRFMAGLDFPDFEQNYEFVAMKHPNEYPYCEGRIVSSSGINIPVEAFLNEFEEIHVKHSTALHGRLKDGRTYLVGPLARVNLNFDQLPDSVKEIAKEIGFEVPCRNNFKSIIARALETLFAVDHAIEILEKYDDTPAPYIQIA
ncbi:MAG: nickel-dependent hydrogenase large subunit, partial [Phycisphaerales bacterium]|nr:nickel-dependent hydrogenase large subunit [Phycisphaerales bacterium]